MLGDSIVKCVNGVNVTYSYGNGGWSPSEPTLAVGEAFCSYKYIGFAWYRNFIVWPYGIEE
jgi:hypothetical protein